MQVLHYLRRARPQDVDCSPYLVAIYYARLLIYDCASQRTDETSLLLLVTFAYMKTSVEILFKNVTVLLLYELKKKYTYICIYLCVCVCCIYQKMYICFVY